jgi:hypothetical protein
MISSDETFILYIPDGGLIIGSELLIYRSFVIILIYRFNTHWRTEVTWIVDCSADRMTGRISH